MQEGQIRVAVPKQEIHTLHTHVGSTCACMAVCVLAQSHHMFVASSWGRQPSRTVGVTATLQSCFRAGTGISRTIGATGGLTKWRLEALSRVPLARNGELERRSNDSWVEVCKVAITVCVLRDGQTDVKDWPRTGLAFYCNFAMLPFLHFPSGHEGSCLHDVRQSNPGQGQGICSQLL